MGDRYALTVEREIPGPIDAVFDAWLDAATMAQWMTPAPDISVDVTSDPVVGGPPPRHEPCDQQQLGEPHRGT